jgi:Ca2+-binding RTX toxin-like protein
MDQAHHWRRDRWNGTDGDDFLRGGRGEDLLDGGKGFDVIHGGKGDDTLYGGAQNDFVLGDRGDDVLHGDSGLPTGRGDLGADRLSGGRGNDVLWVGEGLDAVNGGDGHDTFAFKFSNPQTPLAVGTGAAFAAIEDFKAADDTLAFDVPGLGTDAAGANFADGSGGVNGGARRGRGRLRDLLQHDGEHRQPPGGLGARHGHIHRALHGRDHLAGFPGHRLHGERLRLRLTVQPLRRSGGRPISGCPPRLGSVTACAATATPRRQAPV